MNFQRINEIRTSYPFNIFVGFLDTNSRRQLCYCSSTCFHHLILWTLHRVWFTYIDSGPALAWVSLHQMRRSNKSAFAERAFCHSASATTSNYWPSHSGPLRSQISCRHQTQLWNCLVSFKTNFNQPINWKHRWNKIFSAAPPSRTQTTQYYRRPIKWTHVLSWFGVGNLSEYSTLLLSFKKAWMCSRFFTLTTFNLNVQRKQRSIVSNVSISEHIDTRIRGRNMQTYIFRSLQVTS